MFRSFSRSGSVTSHFPPIYADPQNDAAQRRQTRTSGNAAARARAIKVESDLLATLADRLGVEDVSLGEFIDQTQDLIRALRAYALRDPDATRSLIQTLRDYPSLSDVKDALRTLIGDKK